MTSNRYIALAIALMALSACNRQDNLRPDTSYRLTEATNYYEQILETSAGKPWLLVTYPSSKLSYGGFNYILKFQDGLVTALGELTQGSVTTPYRVIVGEGATLNFSVFNSSVYAIYNPSSSQPAGLEGDIDYTIERYENGIFYLRGRRSDNRMEMRPFEGEDPEQYIQQLKTNKDLLARACILTLHSASSDATTTTQAPILDFHTDERHLYVTNGSDTQKYPYAYTPTGVAFYAPFTLAGQSVSALNIVKEDSSYYLELPDGTRQNMQILPTEIDYNSKNAWIYATNGYMSPGFLNLFNKVRGQEADPAVDGSFGGVLRISRVMTFGNSWVGYPALITQEACTQAGVALGYFSYWAARRFSMRPVGGKDKQVELLDGGLQAGGFLQLITTFTKGFIDRQPYTYEKLDDNTYKMTSVGDSNYWFILNNTNILPSFASTRSSGDFTNSSYTSVSPAIEALYNSNNSQTLGEQTYSIYKTFVIGNYTANVPGIYMWGEQSSSNSSNTKPPYTILLYQLDIVPVWGQSNTIRFVDKNVLENSWDTQRYPFAAQMVNILKDKSPFLVTDEGDGYSLLTSTVDSSYWLRVRSY